MSIFSKGKLSKPEFISKMICTLLTVLLFGLVTSIDFPGDTNGSNGIMHVAFNITFGIMLFFYVIILFRKSLDENLEFEFSEDDGTGNYYAGVTTLVVVITLMLISSNFYTNAKVIYNKHYTYANQTIQLKQAKETYYDNMWKTYQIMDNVAKTNKETFIEVTNILMSARTDGEHTAWKWVQENQPVPYSEFTSFYKDLSNFIRTQRAGYLVLENKSQEIAQKNNTMLDTLPNKWYNIVIGLPHIEYKAGFTSSKTQKVFTTGLEEIK